MNCQLLFDCLRKLNPSGSDGFEGLIAQLLAALTGRRFLLAKPGYQAGRDMSTGLPGANRIAVECKRYLNETPLNERELLGELVQVSYDISQLDLWVVVATRKVGDKLQDLFSQEARSKGFEALIIDTETDAGNSISSLAILCAHAPEIVVSFIQRNSPDADTEKLRDILDSISSQQEYPQRLVELKSNLSSPTIGFENLRHSQNQWLLTRFQSASESHVAFGQVLNISDQDVRLIERLKAWENIDEWLGSWKNNHPFLAILGEEGDGKTWGTASYLLKKLRLDDKFPLVLFITSKNIPSTNEPQELLARIVARQSGKFDDVYWKRRLERWKERGDQVNPLIFLILDGLNERQDIDWRSLLEKLNVPPWNNIVACVVTCRTHTWEKKYSSLSHLNFQQWIIPPYNDSELYIALAVHHLKASDIDANLLPLMRKPRYFDLVVRLRQVMAESGDVTVERLLYEDWRDRISKKSGLQFSHEEFQALIRDLAEKSLPQSKSFSEREIENLVPTDERIIVQELISSGILKPDLSKEGRYTVERKRLIQGFGLLLKEEVSRAISSGDAIEERIARLLEPQSDMDIKVEICGAAVFHAVADRNFPEVGRLALLQEWFKGRNFDERLDESIVAYFPVCPETYLKLAEIVWSDASENSLAQEILMHGLLKWRGSEKLDPVMIRVFERWLGFVHLYGFRFQRGSKGEKAEEIRLQIEERLGCKLTPGTFSFAGYDFTAIEDDGLLRLARVALAIISHYGEKQKFIKAFATWSLSRALMGHPNEYELASWVLKTAQDNIWRELKFETENLIGQNSRVTQQAAYFLLSCEGSPAAYALRENLPENLFPPNPLQEIYQRDPCTQYLFTWHRKDYSTCLERSDLDAFHIASSMKELSLEPALPVPSGLERRIESVPNAFAPNSLWKSMGMTIEDHKFEQIEATLYAFAPDAIAGLVKSVIRDVLNRNSLALRQLSLKLKRNVVLLGRDELSAIEQAWNNLLARAGSWDAEERIAEEFLFPGVIYNLSSEKQLEKLLSRPNDALDLLQYEPLFNPLQQGCINDLLGSLVDLKDKTRLKRILWFLSTHCSLVPPASIRNFRQFLECNDTVIRSFALEIIFKSSDLETKCYVRDSEWAWSVSNGPEENYWGSLLLSDFGTDLPYREIRARVHPCYLGHAVKMRGRKNEEVSQYAEDINTVWKNVSEKGPALPGNFPSTQVDCEYLKEVSFPGLIGISSTAYSKTLSFISRDSFWGGKNSIHAKDLEEALDPNVRGRMERLISILRETIKEQEEAGNHWFYKNFSKSCLKEVLMLRPDFLQTWVQAIEPDTRWAERMLRLSQSFYEAILDILLETDPSSAMKLLIRLESCSGGINFIDSDTGIKCRVFSAFRRGRHPAIQEIWEDYLEKCLNDSELFELAFVAQETNNLGWLKQKITQGLNSTKLFEQARAVTFMGFLEDENGLKDFESVLKRSNSWVRSVAEKALHDWKQNVWAKTWFKKYIEEKENVRAWASFNLFLKCADRRFWLWKEKLSSDFEIGSDRLTFLNFNIDGIKKSIEENEKNWGKTLLYEKVLENQVWPWMEHK
jgi:hypothetical protein